jgi:hypothetical protein
VFAIALLSCSASVVPIDGKQDNQVMWIGETDKSNVYAIETHNGIDIVLCIIVENKGYDKDYVDVECVN